MPMRCRGRVVIGAVPVVQERQSREQCSQGHTEYGAEDRAHRAADRQAAAVSTTRTAAGR